MATRLKTYRLSWLSYCSRHDISHAHIAGISLGGLIAQSLAATKPDMVDRLVLIDTTPRYTDELRSMWAERASFGAQCRRWRAY